jgi:hypothetical protein
LPVDGHNPIADACLEEVIVGVEKAGFNGVGATSTYAVLGADTKEVYSPNHGGQDDLHIAR